MNERLATLWDRVCATADVRVLTDAVITNADGDVLYDLQRADLMAVCVTAPTPDGEYTIIVPCPRDVENDRLAQGIVEVARMRTPTLDAWVAAVTQ